MFQKHPRNNTSFSCCGMKSLFFFEMQVHKHLWIHQNGRIGSARGTMCHAVGLTLVVREPRTFANRIQKNATVQAGLGPEDFLQIKWGEGRSAFQKCLFYKHHYNHDCAIKEKHLRLSLCFNQKVGVGQSMDLIIP